MGYSVFDIFPFRLHSYFYKNLARQDDARFVPRPAGVHVKTLLLSDVFFWLLSLSHASHTGVRCITFWITSFTVFIYSHVLKIITSTASWSSGQSFWLLIMRSRGRFPVLPWGFFLEEEDPPGGNGLGSLVECRFKAPPGTSYSYITIHLIGTT
jgi:hypothetical protein